MQYKLQLQTLKKGNLSLKDYLGKMKNLMDILAACGHSIPNADQVLYVLGGVGLEYDSVVVHVTSRVDSLTVSDVGALLMAHESRIESYSLNNETTAPSVNTATVPSNSQKKSEFSSFNSQPFLRGRGRVRGRNSRGGHRGWNYSSGRPVCQICGITGHVAEKCHYRFDPDFHRQYGGYSHGSFQKQYSGPPSNMNPPQRTPMHYPVAALASNNAEPSTEEWWYPDSGASHHVTNDLANLSLGSEYAGPGCDSSQIQQIIRTLDAQFSLKDLGALSYFLGIEVHKQSDGSLFLSQSKYARDLLLKTKMHQATSLPTPMSTGAKLSVKDGDPFPEVTLYRSTVGALQYLTITRPDISYSVNKVCQFMHTPLITHWKAVKRTLRYINGTLDFGVHLRTFSCLSLSGYCDADWGNDPDDRRSTSRFYWFLGNSPISWSSNKQNVASPSSTEAEYRSLANAASELLWIQSLLQELRIPHIRTPTLWCDKHE